MRLILLRVGESELGTFGVLRYGDVPFALTLEQPWLDNEPDYSSIPAGSYTCARVASPKFGDTFEVMDVPGRSHILFHKGNTLEDTHGCILVGEEFAGSYDDPILLDSKHGFEELLILVQGLESFELLILDPPEVEE